MSLLFLAAVPGGTLADGPRERDDDEHEEDHDRVDRAVESGEVLPLEEILALLDGRIDGEIVGLEVERESGVWVYEFRVITTAGRLVEVVVDAATGAVLEVEDD